MKGLIDTIILILIYPAFRMFGLLSGDTKVWFIRRALASLEKQGWFDE